MENICQIPQTIAPIPLPGDLSEFPEILSHLDALKQNFKNTPLPTMGQKTNQFIKTILEEIPQLEMILSIVAHINDQATRHIIQKGEEALKAKGMGNCPCPYCWISMGSDARGEQVVRTDQDNALIYDDTGSKKDRAEQYFKCLAQEVTQCLTEFGFAKCKGEVMATNPIWRRSQQKWYAVLEQWVGSADPADVRKLTILLDFRGVYGCSKLSQNFHQKIFTLFKKNLSVNHYLVRDDNLFAAPRTFLGKIRTHKLPNGEYGFNLKTSGLVHLINGVRILSINHDITNPSTLERLNGLKAKGIIKAAHHHQYRNAFLFLTRLKIKNHLYPRPGIPDHHIIISELSQGTRKELETALNTVTALQKRVQGTYNIPWLNFFN